MAVCARGLAVYQVIQGVGSVGTFFVAAAPTGWRKTSVPTPRGSTMTTVGGLTTTRLVPVDGDEPSYP